MEHNLKDEDRFIIPFPINDKESYVDLFIRNTKDLECYNVDDKIIVINKKNIELFLNHYKNYLIKKIDIDTLF